VRCVSLVGFCRGVLGQPYFFDAEALMYLCKERRDEEDFEGNIGCIGWYWMELESLKEWGVGCV
jgi:hypothetical protein